MEAKILVETFEKFLEDGITNFSNISTKFFIPSGKNINFEISCTKFSEIFKFEKSLKMEAKILVETFEKFLEDGITIFSNVSTKFFIPSGKNI